MPTLNPDGFPLYSDTENMPAWNTAYNAHSTALSAALAAAKAADHAADSVATIALLPVTGNWVGRIIFVDENDMLYIWDGTGWWIYAGKKPYFFGSRPNSATSAGSGRRTFITTADTTRGITFAAGEITFQTTGIYQVDLSVVWEANAFGQRNLGIDGTGFTVLGPAVTIMLPYGHIPLTQQFTTYIAVTTPGAVARPYIDQNSLSALDLEGSACVMWESA